MARLALGRIGDHAVLEEAGDHRRIADALGEDELGGVAGNHAGRDLPEDAQDHVLIARGDRFGDRRSRVDHRRGGDHAVDRVDLRREKVGVREERSDVRHFDHVEDGRIVDHRQREPFEGDRMVRLERNVDRHPDSRHVISDPQRVVGRVVEERTADRGTQIGVLHSDHVVEVDPRERGGIDERGRRAGQGREELPESTDFDLVVVVGEVPGDHARPGVHRAVQVGHRVGERVREERDAPAREDLLDQILAGVDAVGDSGELPARADRVVVRRRVGDRDDEARRLVQEDRLTGALGLDPIDPLVLADVLEAQ